MEVLTVSLPGTMSPAECVHAIRAAHDRGAVPVIAPPDGIGTLLRESLPAALPPDGEAFMVLPTSGTTTTPRAVVRSAQSWRSSLAPFTQVTAITASDVIWAPGTAGSTMALFAAWHALALGLEVVCSGPWRGVPADDAAVRRATVVHCVPPVLGDIVARVVGGGLPQLRLAVVAGALLPDRLRSAARKAGLDLLEYYGAAELSFVAAGRDALRPFPGVEVQVRDGILWCRSPYLAHAVLGPGGAYVRGPGGWASVGDRARLDGDGVIALHGRRAGLLVGGHVVLADDVEQAFADAAGVREVVCLAAREERLGDVVVAVVVPDRRSGQERAGELAGSSTPQSDRELVAALRSLARTRLPRPARPVRYVVLDEVPRTPGGKVSRTHLATSLGLRTPSGP